MRSEPMDLADALRDPAGFVAGMEETVTTTTRKAGRELFSSLWEEDGRWFWSVMFVYPDGTEEPIDGGIEDSRAQAEKCIEKASK